MSIQKPLVGDCFQYKTVCQYVREYHVYMSIWKPLVGDCFQCIKETIYEVGMNTVAEVRTICHCK